MFFFDFWYPTIETIRFLNQNIILFVIYIRKGIRHPKIKTITPKNILWDLISMQKQQNTAQSVLKKIARNYKFHGQFKNISQKT